MGQYYKAVAITEKTMHIVVPDWLKIMEHSYYDNFAVMRMEYLLSKQPRKVMWIWDYSATAPFVWTHKRETDIENWIYVEDLFRISKEWREDELSFLERDPTKIYYLRNITRNEYINMNRQEVNKEIQDSMWWVVHPLPLLCRAESGESWWDYHSEINKDKLWLWCWDLITIDVVSNPIDECLSADGYKDMTDILYFKE
jgi:hypothetical protein